MPLKFRQNSRTELEGQTLSYGFRLLAPPRGSDTVTVTVTGDTDTSVPAINVADHVFDCNNWEMWHDVFIATKQDSPQNRNDEVIHLTHTLTSSSMDTRFHNEVCMFTFAVLDNTPIRYPRILVFESETSDTQVRSVVVRENMSVVVWVRMSSAPTFELGPSRYGTIRATTQQQEDMDEMPEDTTEIVVAVDRGLRDRGSTFGSPRSFTWVDPPTEAYQNWQNRRALSIRATPDSEMDNDDPPPQSVVLTGDLGVWQEARPVTIQVEIIESGKWEGVLTLTVTANLPSPQFVRVPVNTTATLSYTARPGRTLPDTEPTPIFFIRETPSIGRTPYTESSTLTNRRVRNTPQTATFNYDGYITDAVEEEDREYDVLRASGSITFEWINEPPPPLPGDPAVDFTFNPSATVFVGETITITVNARYQKSDPTDPTEPTAPVTWKWKEATATSTPSLDTAGTLTQTVVATAKLTGYKPKEIEVSTGTLTWRALCTIRARIGAFQISGPNEANAGSTVELSVNEPPVTNRPSDEPAGTWTYEWNGDDTLTGQSLSVTAPPVGRPALTTSCTATYSVTGCTPVTRSDSHSLTGTTPPPPGVDLKGTAFCNVRPVNTGRNGVVYVGQKTAGYRVTSWGYTRHADDPPDNQIDVSIDATSWTTDFTEVGETNDFEPTVTVEPEGNFNKLVTRFTFTLGPAVSPPTLRVTATAEPSMWTLDRTTRRMGTTVFSAARSGGTYRAGGSIGWNPQTPQSVSREWRADGMT